MKRPWSIKNTAFILMVLFLGSCINETEQEIVSTRGRMLLLNDLPYQIKAVCYNPVPKGSDNRDFYCLDEDLKLMAEAGINTIRVYSPIDDVSVLDRLHEAGIKVIMGIGYNRNGNFDILSGSFLDYVNNFKAHPALLLWELGNEYNYHPEWFNGDITNWYQALNNAAGLIHQTDTFHPVSTAHGELPDSLALASCPNIAIWGLNVYRWDDPESIFEQWKAICEKPMYLSEAGADSYMVISKAGYKKGINEQAQADALNNILDDVFTNNSICSGVSVFAFTDELWKAGNNHQYDIGGWAPNSSGVPYDGTPNEEYWGIVDIDRNKKKAFYVLSEKYKNNY